MPDQPQSPPPREEPIRIFISYAREDRRWLDPSYTFNLIPFLADSLRRQGVTFWFDNDLRPGDEYKLLIESEIDKAHISMLVISQNFLNSDFIETFEMPRISARAQRGETLVVPVLVEPCDWNEYPFLADRQMVPSASPLIDFTESPVQWSRVKFQILDGLKAQIKRIHETANQNREQEALAATRRAREQQAEAARLAAAQAARERELQRAAQQQYRQQPAAQSNPQQQTAQNMPQQQPRGPMTTPPPANNWTQTPPMNPGPYGHAGPYHSGPYVVPPKPSGLSAKMWAVIGSSIAAFLLVFFLIIYHFTSTPASTPVSQPSAPVIAGPAPSNPTNSSSSNTSTTQSTPSHDGLNAISSQADKYYDANDYAKAFPLYTQTCNGGITGDCSRLGLMYEDGNGVGQDVNQAFTLYRKACDANFDAGCNNLGRMYEYGKGVSTDVARAASLYRQACNDNSATGCAYLGDMYENGKGVVLNKTEAISLYHKGCNGGNKWGCDQLKRLKQPMTPQTPL